MDLFAIISKMDALKQELDALRPFKEDRLSRLHQKLKLDWNYHSNSIEGNTLSKSETKSFILFNITAKGKPFRDYLEMRGHNDALNKLYQIISHDLKITEKLIQEFHKIILVESYADSEAEINPGQWKKRPNYLYTATGERIDFSPPEEVPQRMNALINWLNNHIDPPKRKKKKYDLHPLLIAAGFHTQFISIHPFGDGNGRMARILSNLILMLCGYVPAIIKLDNRLDYYTAINTSNLNEPENLAIFLGQSTIESLEIALKAAKGESIEEEEDFDKKLHLLHQKLANKKRAKPQQTPESLEKIFEQDISPFFDQLVIELTKFDEFFESTSINLTTLQGSTIQSYHKGKDQIKEALEKNKLKDINFLYSFTDMSHISRSLSLNIPIRISFEKTAFTIKDDFTGQNIFCNYKNSFSINEREKFIKKIKEELLAKTQILIDE